MLVEGETMLVEGKSNAGRVGETMLVNGRKQC